MGRTAATGRLVSLSGCKLINRLDFIHVSRVCAEVLPRLGSVSCRSVGMWRMGFVWLSSPRVSVAMGGQSRRLRLEWSAEAFLSSVIQVSRPFYLVFLDCPVCSCVWLVVRGPFIGCFHFLPALSKMCFCFFLFFFTVSFTTMSSSAPLLAAKAGTQLQKW